MKVLDEVIGTVVVSGTTNMGIASRMESFSISRNQATREKMNCREKDASMDQCNKSGSKMQNMF